MAVFHLGNILKLSWSTFLTGICIFAHKTLHVFLYHSGIIVILIGNAVNNHGYFVTAIFFFFELLELATTVAWW